MSNIDKAIEVLNGQGACCGDCGREPGDPLSYCGDCARCLSSYAQALAEAGLLAPDLETVAGMHYEYAAQAQISGRWMFIAPFGAVCISGQRASWYKTKGAAEIVSTQYPEHRTVRRLVGDIEVCE